MKKLSILFICALALGIATTSCSNNESSNSSNVSIIGMWVYDTFTHTKLDTTSEEMPYDNPACPDNSFLNIKTGNVLQEGVVNYDNCDFGTYDGTWSYQNKILHIVEGTYQVDFLVVSLTSTKLVLKYTVPEDTTEYYTITLNKSK